MAISSSTSASLLLLLLFLPQCLICSIMVHWGDIDVAFGETRNTYNKTRPSRKNTHVRCAHGRATKRSPPRTISFRRNENAKGVLTAVRSDRRRFPLTPFNLERERERERENCRPRESGATPHGARGAAAAVTFQQKEEEGHKTIISLIWPELRTEFHSDYEVQ